MYNYVFIDKTSLRRRKNAMHFFIDPPDIIREVRYMHRERFLSLVRSFPQQSVGVLGDFFLDKYIEIDPALDEPSLETGKPAHQVVGRRQSPGAAGNVAANLASLGARALRAFGLIGDDGEGYDLARLLDGIGCATGTLFRDSALMTPTYMKPRNIHVAGLTGEYDRYDIKNRMKTPTRLEERIIAALDEFMPSLDALMIVDQDTGEDCGVVTTHVREYIGALAARFPGTICFADSRTRTLSFKNVSVKPNQFELLGIDHPSPWEAVDQRRLAEETTSARQKTGAPVFVTMGSLGIMVSDPEPHVVPGFPVTGPVDPTGAGDSAAAGIVLALAAGALPEEAALIGNLAASVTVAKLGECGTSSPEELIARFDCRCGNSSSGGS